MLVPYMELTSGHLTSFVQSIGCSSSATLPGSGKFSVVVISFFIVVRYGSDGGLLDGGRFDGGFVAGWCFDYSVNWLSFRVLLFARGVLGVDRVTGCVAFL